MTLLYLVQLNTDIKVRNDIINLNILKDKIL